MPKITMPIRWDSTKQALLDKGRLHVEKFCLVNDLPIPKITSVPLGEWHFNVCAYYRPDKGIMICLPKCQTLAGEVTSRNWSWPGSVTDREPFGVVCHELGHHCDWHKGDMKYSYSSNYSSNIMTRSGEAQISGYCPNPAEWFAEMFRVFITNPALLFELRNRTYNLLRQDWKPIVGTNWLTTLGENIPQRIISNLIKKGCRRI